MNFEEQLIQKIQNRILGEIASLNLVKVDYQDRYNLPKDFVEKAWTSLDWDKVLTNVKQEMERRVCNAIIGNMETEIKTDIKKLMSVDGFREKLRINIYPKIMAIMSEQD